MANTRQTRFWTYEDLFDLPDDGTRYEIIEGVLYEMPGASRVHNRLIMTIIAMILPIAEAIGAHLYRLTDVFIGDANPVQPDLLLLLPDQLNSGIEARSKARLHRW
ncbi:MAG: Uma2 family endonuclease [Thermomicrobiales bacterium]